MKFILLTLSMLNMYKVKWSNDYLEIELYENVSDYIELPTAKLYDEDGNYLESEVSYFRGINNTSLSVVNSNHVKTFKVDYQVNFIDYDISFEHTITFNIVDNIAPTFLDIPELSFSLKTKRLSEKQIIDNLIYEDNYYKNEELIIKIEKLNFVNINFVGNYEIVYVIKDPSNNITRINGYYNVFNDTLPTIKYNNPIIFEYGNLFNYYDYFKITDPNDNNLVINVDISKVDFSKLGFYKIYLDVTNNSTITTYITADIVIVDTKIPDIQFSSNLIFGVSFYDEKNLKDLIIKVNDNYDLLSEVDVEIFHDINFNKIGKYEVLYRLADYSNNIFTKIIIIEVKDFLKPTIALSKDLKIEVYSTNINYLDYFLITDNYDEISNLVIRFNEKLLNYKILGEYYLEVEVNDLSKNKITQRFLVTIVDSISPKINLVLDIILTSYEVKEDIYFKDFFSISDNYDNYSLINIEVLTNIDFSKLGTNLVEFKFSDASNNITYIDETIYIIDEEEPLIILNAYKIVLNINSNEVDYYSYITSISDNYSNESELNLKIENNINYFKIGYYKITYSVSDSSLNNATETIDVYVDLKKERLIYGENITLKQNDKYFNLMGISLSDDVVSIDSFPAIIDTSKPGLKQVLYVAYDVRGNYEQFIQDINIKEDTKFKLDNYFITILINGIILSYLGFYLFKKKKTKSFELS